MVSGVTTTSKPLNALNSRSAVRISFAPGVPTWQKGMGGSGVREEAGAADGEGDGEGENRSEGEGEGGGEGESEGKG